MAWRPLGQVCKANRIRRGAETQERPCPQGDERAPSAERAARATGLATSGTVPPGPREWAEYGLPEGPSVTARSSVGSVRLRQLRPTRHGGRAWPRAGRFSPSPAHRRPQPFQVPCGFRLPAGEAELVV